MIRKTLLSITAPLLLSFLSLIFCPNSYAEQTEQLTESSTESNDNGPIVKDEFEWQFILDLSVVYDPKIIAGIEQEDPWHYFMPGVLVDLSYKGFFLQSNQRRSNMLLGGLELGYQLLVKDNWELDIISKAYMQGYDSESLIEYGGGDEDLIAGLRERDGTVGIALRYSYYFPDALFTLDLASAHTGDDENGDHVQGFIVDSFYSYLLPYRNWDIYLGAGLTYYSQDIVDYYIGVGATEVTEDRPEFTANDGFRAQLEVYAQHPISANWSFNTGITHSIFSSHVKDSPIVDTNHITQVMVGVLYVF